MSIQAEHEKLMKILEKLAEQYATDANGHFDLAIYTAFKAGLVAGLAAKVQLKANLTEQ